MGQSEDPGLYPESEGRLLVDFRVVGDTHRSDLYFEESL